MRMDAESIEMMNKEIQTRGKSKIVIPDNATNGDVIKAMFPNLDIEIAGHNITSWIDEHRWNGFDWDWWNAPYKESKNGNA